MLSVGESSADDEQVTKGANADIAPPTASITTVHVRQGQLTKSLTLYGTVVPASGSTFTVSSTCDAVIDRWDLPLGAPVSAGATLGEAHPTPEAMATRNEALAAETAAQDDLRFMRSRYELKLVTHQELAQAESAARIAAVRAAAWRSRCPDEHLTIVSPKSGMLFSAAVSAGQMVTAGTMIAVVATGAQDARLGIEPRDAAAIPAGALFTLAASLQPDVHLPPQPAAHFSALIDPDTKLLTVLVPLGSGSVAFGSPISASVERPGPTGLLVPRAALVRDDPDWCVFTVVKNMAHRTAVTVLAESGDDAAIASPALAVDQVIAVIGSSVLTDGMQVHEAPAPTPTEPAVKSGAP